MEDMAMAAMQIFLERDCLHKKNAEIIYKELDRDRYHCIEASLIAASNTE